MEVLHRGFDGLDVSFQAQIDTDLEKKLEVAKEAAADAKENQLIEHRGVPMHVGESGAKGGYRYRCDTGPFGATWFFKRPNPRDPWGIRVSVKSLPLAVYGLGQVRANLYAFLDALGIKTAPQGVSIGRVDYAVDILAPGFVLDADCFVMHARATRADRGLETEIERYGRSTRLTSVTAGKMPGRQVQLYDKRDEVISKRKVHWWEIWNAARTNAGNLPLDPADRANSTVWRIEFRAGKDHLKDRWQIRNWADLDNRLGDLMAKSANAVRYCIPTSDSNRSRWPDDPIWQIARREVTADLFEMRSHADPDRVREVLRSEHRRMLQAQILGLTISAAVTDGKSADDFESYIKHLPVQLLKYANHQFDSIDKRFAKACKRHTFRLN